MENKFRNEMEIKLGPETILLRPTFENIAAMEQHVGSVTWLVWKYARGASKTPDDNAARSMPALTEVAKIIYFNQAATRDDNPTQKKFNLQEIWDLVQYEGAAVIKDVVTYIGRLMAGNRAIDVDEAHEGEKKS